jgi:hypothetical protein
MFAPPIVVFLLVHFMATLWASSVPWGGLRTQVNIGVPQVVVGGAMAIAAALSVLADVAALSWFGMWMGMTSKNTNMAALKTIVFVQVVPAIVIQVSTSLLLMMALVPFMSSARSGSKVWASVSGWFVPLLLMALPLALRLAKDWFFIAWSRTKLYRHFRDWAAPPGLGGWSLAVPPVIPKLSS